MDRRSNIVARLEEQKLLLNDPKYVRKVRTWVKKDGELTPLDRQQRVLPWWRVNSDGSYVFFVRWGGRPIEFEKGKNGIAVPSLNKIPLVIDILITAVRNGELDAQLAQARKPTTVLNLSKRRDAHSRGVSPPGPARDCPAGFRVLGKSSGEAGASRSFLPDAARR